MELFHGRTKFHCCSDLQAIKGQGTVVHVDCNSATKLCKKLKVSAKKGQWLLKHYKDGDFHKDYDRQERLKSMVKPSQFPSSHDLKSAKICR